MKLRRGQKYFKFSYGYPFSGNYPYDVFYPGYAMLSNYPTLCGGNEGSEAFKDECYSFTESGTWDLVANLDNARAEIGGVRISAEEILFTGKL